MELLQNMVYATICSGDLAQFSTTAPMDPMGAEALTGSPSMCWQQFTRATTPQVHAAASSAWEQYG